MILYHGSLNGKITRFGALHHFGTKAAALKRLGECRTRKGWLYKVRIEKSPKRNIREVLDYGLNHHPWSLATMLAVGGSLTNPEGLSVYRQKTTGGSKRRLLKLLKDHKITLLHYENKIEGDISWIVPDPAQIEIISVEPVTKLKQP
jgi:hypothetical protein